MEIKKRDLFSLVVLTASSCVVYFNWQPQKGSKGCDEKQFHKDARSAINRTKTQECKNEIIEIACRNSQDLYPDFIKSQCDVHFQDADINVGYLGCYQDSSEARLLEGMKVILKDRNAPKTCLKHCTEIGFEFAGVQYSHECFCGNHRPDKVYKVDESECQQPCSGDPTQTCGGYFRMNVFRSTVIAESELIKKNDQESQNRIRVAYLLIVHGRGLRQILRLFKRIQDSQDFFYFHVDKRSGYLFRILKQLEQMFPNNVKVTDRRWATIWGGASLLKMMKSSMQEMLEMKWQFDYVINLSESDYILKNPIEFKMHLLKNKGRNFVKSHGRETATFLKKQGLDRTFYECDNHMYRLGPRSLPGGLTLDGGSDWVCLSKDLIHYILSSNKDELLQGLESIFEYTLLPAETFFHTVLRNSKFCSTYTNNNLRITNWKRQFGCQCQHKAVVDWCGCSPNVFTMSDWKKISTSIKRPVFFARKFDPTISQTVINNIDAMIYGENAHSALSLTSQYWQNEFSALDDAHRGSLFSMASLLAEQCALMSSEKNSELFEVNILYEEDFAINALVMLNSSDNSKIECQFELPEVGIVSETLTISVNTKFDVKERVFRNPLNAMDVFDEPHFLVKTSAEEDTIFNLLLISPKGLVVHAFRDQFLNATKGYHVEKFPTNLISSGIWTLVLYEGENEPFTMEFVILSPGGDSEDLDQKSKKSINLTPFEKGITQAILSQKQQTNNRASTAITQWIKSTYTFSDFCQSHQLLSSSQSSNNSCLSKEWSSLRYDPFSNLV